MCASVSTNQIAAFAHDVIHQAVNLRILMIFTMMLWSLLKIPLTVNKLPIKTAAFQVCMLDPRLDQILFLRTALIISNRYAPVMWVMLSFTYRVIVMVARVVVFCFIFLRIWLSAVATMQSIK